MASIGTLSAEFTANTQDFESKSKRLEKTVSSLKQQIEKTRAEAARPFQFGAIASGAAGGLAALFGVSAINSIRQAATGLFEYSSQLEATSIAFTTMLGSAQKATAHLKELKDFALKTPFQFQELVAASQRMQALGFSAQQVVPLLNDIGNAVAAAGGGSERLDRITLALSQMQSKGRVATQELNQLAESGISGFGILEKATGKAGDELRKMVEQGKISSDTFIKAFQEFSKLNYGGLMEKQSRTAIGALSNIKDAVLQLSEEALNPTFQLIRDNMVGLADSLQTNKAAWQSWANFIAAQVGHVLEGIRLVIRDFALIAAGFQKTGEAYAGIIGSARRASGGAGGEFTVGGKKVRLDSRGFPINDRPSRFIDPNAQPEGEFATAGFPGGPVSAGRAARPTGTGSGTGGGRGRGGGSARDAVREAKELQDAILTGLIDRVRSEEGELKRSFERKTVMSREYFTETIRLETERYNATKERLAKELKGAKTALEIQNNKNAVFQEEERHADVLYKAEKDLTENLKEQYKLRDQVVGTVEDQIKAMIRLNQLVEDSFAGLALGPVDTATSQLEKLIAQGAPSAEPLEALVRFRERMRDVAGEITGILDQSISDGISRGAKAGLQSLALGFLDMIQQVVLGRLKNALAEALSGVGGGGGGFFSGLVKSIIGGAIGGAAGGGLLGNAGQSIGPLSTPTNILTSGIIHRASGGPISPGNVYKVHKDELIMPMQDAMVYNKSQQGGTTIINNIAMPPVAGNRSYASPQAKREMALALAAAIQGAQS